MTTSRLTQLSATKYADLTDSVEEARNRTLSIQRRINSIENAIRNNPASLAENEPDLDRQRERMGHEQSRFLALSQVATSIRTWLLQLSPAAVLLDAPDPSKRFGLQDGETYVKAVEDLRVQIEHFCGVIRLLQQSVLPITDLRAQADAYVDALARTAKPSLSVTKDVLSIKFTIEGYADRAVALLAWQDPEALKARLYREIDDMRAVDIRQERMVKTIAQRAELQADVEERLRDLEAKEEFLIGEALARENTTISRRPSAAPAAILGLRVVSAASAAAAA